VLVIALAGGVACNDEDRGFDQSTLSVVPSREQAEEALDEAVRLAQDGDFEALCEQAAAAPEQCRGFFPAEAGYVPDGPPEVRCHLPRDAQDHNGQLTAAGRILVLEGRDAVGNRYRSEMLAQYAPDHDEVRLLIPVWWIDLGVDRGDFTTLPPDPPDWCDHEGASAW
jgi:hypothetical protein